MSPSFIILIITGLLVYNVYYDNILVKSFSSSPLMVYWSFNNEVNPRQIFKCTDKVCQFTCPNCQYEIQKTLCSIKNDIIWCDNCSFKLA